MPWNTPGRPGVDANRASRSRRLARAERHRRPRHHEERGRHTERDHVREVVQLRAERRAAQFARHQAVAQVEQCADQHQDHGRAGAAPVGGDAVAVHVLRDRRDREEVHREETACGVAERQDVGGRDARRERGLLVDAVDLGDRPVVAELGDLVEINPGQGVSPRLASAVPR
jgi:hypothetical protein